MHFWLSRDYTVVYRNKIAIQPYNYDWTHFLQSTWHNATRKKTPNFHVHCKFGIIIIIIICQLQSTLFHIECPPNAQDNPNKQFILLIYSAFEFVCMNFTCFCFHINFFVIVFVEISVPQRQWHIEKVQVHSVILSDFDQKIVFCNLTKNTSQAKERERNTIQLTFNILNLWKKQLNDTDNLPTSFKFHLLVSSNLCLS